MGSDYILKKVDHRSAPAIVLLFYLALYILFPAGFSTTDGWNYAAEIKHSGDLFYPFHLLYNLLGSLFCRLPVKAGADTLSCLKIMNALFAVLSVYLVQLVVRKIGMSRLSVILVSCLAGVSFSVIRYATENETYIIPLFFGLLSTYYFASFLQSGRRDHALLSGIWSSLSVLFHLTYICWWTGLLAGFVINRNRRSLSMYLLSSLLIPLVYITVILIIQDNINVQAIKQFMLNDYVKPGFGITGKGLVFSGINLIRSFIQVHGYMFNMVKSSFLFLIPAGISAILVVFTLFRLPSGIKRMSAFDYVLIIILVLNILMAVFSSGNAEFMVMIPVLVFILIRVLFIHSEKFLFTILCGMLIWNISYGIVPLNIHHQEVETYLAESASGEKEAMIIASDDQLLKSMVYYNTGAKECRNIFKSPAVLKLKGVDPQILVAAIDSALAGGAFIYTDCIGPATISRLSMSQGNINEMFFRNYKSELILSTSRVTGTKTVSRITGTRNR